MKQIIIFVLFGLLFVLGCEDKITSSCETAKLEFNGTFSEVQQYVFNAHCVGCHGNAVQNGELNLAAGKSYDQLVNASTPSSSLPRVNPGNSNESYLIKRLLNLEDSVMPPAGKLNNDLILLVRRWIDEGAQNN